MATYAGITYANGAVPASILAPLDGQPHAQLRRDAADAWNRGVAEVSAKTGIELTVRGWNRTLAEQERFFHERYDPQPASSGPFGDVRWYKGVRYARMRGAAAAIPGTSNHGWGLAVDVEDYGNVGQFAYPRRARTIDILKRHGWTDDEGRGVIQEPWHLVYDPARDTKPKTTAPTQEDEMSTEDSRKLDRIVEILGGSTENASVAEVQWAVLRTVRALRSEVAANRSAITALAEARGVDPERIYEIVDANTKAALEGIEITFTTTDPEDQT